MHKTVRPYKCTQKDKRGSKGGGWEKQQGVREDKGRNDKEIESRDKEKEVDS